MESMAIRECEGLSRCCEAWGSEKSVGVEPAETRRNEKMRCEKRSGRRKEQICH